MSKYIAIVEDEPDIVDLISHHLEKAGFKTKGFHDAESFLKSFDRTLPGLIILDLLLPDMDGFDICKYVRRSDSGAAIPIIMLTAKTEETDKVLGLELGADDYVTKPFSPRELVARVKAVLRRGEPTEATKVIDVGENLVIDPRKFAVTIEEKQIDLTPTEFKILELLSSKKGWVFTRKQILDHLWGQDKIVVDRTVDVHIRHLRQKLGEAARFIKNIRGVGYKLEE